MHCCTGASIIYRMYKNPSSPLWLGVEKEKPTFAPMELRRAGPQRVRAKVGFVGPKANDAGGR
jgi:hypothetical protein